MKALLVIDVQNGIVKQKDFSKVLENIEYLIKDFKKKDLPIFFIQHMDDDVDSPLYKASDGVTLYDDIAKYADSSHSDGSQAINTFTKTTPNAFFDTSLENTLKEQGVDHIYICGFNTEYCCLFTAIAGHDRRFQVTFMEDATGSVGDEDMYEMKGLDIQDFVGSVLNWSGVIEVLDLEEYVE